MTLYNKELIINNYITDMKINNTTLKCAHCNLYIDKSYSICVNYSCGNILISHYNCPMITFKNILKYC